MEFGLFDWVDHHDVPLGQLYEERLEVRRAQSKTIVDRFFAFCEEEIGRVLDETPTAKAIGYVGNIPMAEFPGPPPEVLKHLGLA